MKLLEKRKKEEAPVINILQHNLEFLATKSLYAFKENKNIFIKIPEVLGMKSFQQKVCIFL